MDYVPGVLIWVTLGYGLAAAALLGLGWWLDRRDRRRAEAHRTQLLSRADELLDEARRDFETTL